MSSGNSGIEENIGGPNRRAGGEGVGVNSNNNAKINNYMNYNSNNNKWVASSEVVDINNNEMNSSNSSEDYNN